MFYTFYIFYSCFVLPCSKKTKFDHILKFNCKISYIFFYVLIIVLYLFIYTHSKLFKNIKNVHREYKCIYSTHKN